MHKQADDCNCVPVLTGLLQISVAIGGGIYSRISKQQRENSKMATSQCTSCCCLHCGILVCGWIGAWISQQVLHDRTVTVLYSVLQCSTQFSAADR